MISSLQSLCKEHDRETARQAIETLLTLANNIIKSPTDEKYRKVKKQNKTFSLKVWQLPEAQEFLFHWGWKEDDECIVLPSDEDIQLVKQILLKKLNTIPSSAGAASKSEPLTEKEKQLQEERRKLLEKKKLEDQEKARIKAQIQADRKDSKDREIRESRARKLDKFGGKMTKFEDIGVDLNKGGG